MKKIEDLMNAEEKKQKSEQLAEVIILMKQFFPLVDLEHAKECIKNMEADAQRYDSAAVLMRNYNPKKAQVMQWSAKALEGLVAFIECQVQINELKQEIGQEDDAFAKIEKMFAGF